MPYLPKNINITLDVSMYGLRTENRFRSQRTSTPYKIKVNNYKLLLLSCRSLSGRAGPLPIKGNKLLGSLGYRSNPQGALLQAEWLRAEEGVGAILPDSVRSRGTSTAERRPR